jgi:DNA-binding transcriptional LysR family regulator
MNFEQLKVFLAVVDFKSFTKAADALYISHSTTSRNVAALEESLGVRLLVRDNRSVRLTPAGEILYREGQKLVKKIDAIEGAVQNAGLGLAGKITIASIDFYSENLIDGYSEFCRQYPDIIVGLYHKDVAEIWNQVNTGEADVGIGFSYSMPEDMEEFELRPLTRERFCLVAPKDHPLAERDSVKISEVEGGTYVSLSVANYDFIKKLDEQSRFAQGDGSGFSVVPSVESLFLKVRSGTGISMVPYPIAQKYGEGCAILDVEDMDSTFDVVLIYRKDNLNPSLPLFVDTIMASFGVLEPQE